LLCGKIVTKYKEANPGSNLIESSEEDYDPNEAISTNDDCYDYLKIFLEALKRNHGTSQSGSRASRLKYGFLIPL
jgi:hypothetical protein